MFSYYIKLIGQFFQDMKRQKLRTFLTIIGIMWGTTAVVLLLSFGRGIQEFNLKEFRGMGRNIVMFAGRTTTKAYSGLGKGRWIGLREEDAHLLKNRIPEMEFISPERNYNVKANYKRETRRANCSGAYPEYGEVRNLFPEPGGRYINKLDLENKRRTVFIGNKLRDNLFGEGSSVVGRVVNLNGIPFTVIGVMQEKMQGDRYMATDAESAFTAYSTFRETFGARYVDRFVCRAIDPLHTEKMKEGIYQVLGDKYKFDPTDKEALWMWDTTETDQFMTYFFLSFNIFLALGGMLTMLVGGIGVANIMYVVVRERRRELGIKAALGATPLTIMMQFLLETFLIVLVGGVLGFAFSYGVIRIFQNPMLEQVTQYIGKPVFDPPVAMSAILLLGLVSFAAGWSPARRAANMDPVQALEYG